MWTLKKIGAYGNKTEIIKKQEEGVQTLNYKNINYAEKNKKKQSQLRNIEVSSSTPFLSHCYIKQGSCKVIQTCLCEKMHT